MGRSCLSARSDGRWTCLSASIREDAVKGEYSWLIRSRRRRAGRGLPALSETIDTERRPCIIGTLAIWVVGFESEVWISDDLSLMTGSQWDPSTSSRAEQGDDRIDSGQIPPEIVLSGS